MRSLNRESTLEFSRFQRQEIQDVLHFGVLDPDLVDPAVLRGLDAGDRFIVVAEGENLRQKVGY